MNKRQTRIINRQQNARLCFFRCTPWRSLQSRESRVKDACEFDVLVKAKHTHKCAYLRVPHRVLGYVRRDLVKGFEQDGPRPLPLVVHLQSVPKTSVKQTHASHKHSSQAGTSSKGQTTDMNQGLLFKKKHPPSLLQITWKKRMKRVAGTALGYNWQTKATKMAQLMPPKKPSTLL